MTLYLKIKVEKIILEKITLSYKNDKGEQIYHITSFIPLLTR